jgi:glycine/D-amino acid oxidase-like deaminating enzyme
LIGPGIIGVTSALKLLELGRRVQLLERRSMAALETSYHNGCVFTPYFYSPLVSKVERLVDQ